MYTECVGLCSTSFARFVQSGNFSRVRLPRHWYMLSSPVDLIIATACFMELISHYWASCKPFCVPLPDWSRRNSNSIIFLMTFVTSCTGCLSSRESASKSACMYAGVLTMRHLPYLSDMLTSVSDVDALRRHRSADRADLVVPRTKTVRYGDRSFAVSGPKPWNALPAELKTPNISLLDFKSGLKTMLFKQAFA